MRNEIQAFLTILTILLVYRFVPPFAESVSGLLMVPEALRRGFLAADSAILIDQSQTRFSEVWPVWCRFRLPILRLRTLAWIDAEVLRVWPWLWPLWLGPKIVIQRRIFRKTMDRWWRR